MARKTSGQNTQGQPAQQSEQTDQSRNAASGQPDSPQETNDQSADPSATLTTTTAGPEEAAPQDQDQAPAADEVLLTDQDHRVEPTGGPGRAAHEGSTPEGLAPEEDQESVSDQRAVSVDRPTPDESDEKPTHDMTVESDEKPTPDPEVAPDEDPEPAAEPPHLAIDALAEAAETLQDEGYYVVVAQRWPGARNVWMELLLIGTAGVFVVAATNWRNLKLVRGEVTGNPHDLERAARSLTNASAKVEAELVTIGVAPGEIIPVGVTEEPAEPAGQHSNTGRIRVVDPAGVLPLVRSRGRRFRQSHVDRIAARLADVFPQQMAEAVAAARADIAPDPAGEVTDVEPWMTFLNPDQAEIAHREWSGPARIRGAAGTGKTVVGMHRAAYLALTSPEKVLVASLVRTLPKVMERNFARLSPETRHKVEFTSVHRIALEILNYRRVRTPVDLGAAALAFRAAWDKVGVRSILADQPAPVTYWQEEIDHVIKGRGISSMESYLRMDRVGRRYPAKAQLRAQVWSLFNAYQAELATRGVLDLADMLLLADAELAREPWHVAYSAVILDEAQDLSPVGVRFLHRLVGDRPNGLLLIADGQQGVTPGGFHLSEAGVDVTGRDALLRRNMRSDEVLGHVAHTVVSATTFDDLDGFVWHPDRDLTFAHAGGQAPTIVRAGTVREHDEGLLAWLASLAAASEGEVPDVAILSARHTQVGHYRQLLLANGYDVVDLDGYDGSQGAVKIGTMRRAKGLTFTNVALTQLFGESLRDTTLTNPAQSSGVATSLERVEREQREVFSAVSRVTYDLWMGYLAL